MLGIIPFIPFLGADEPAGATVDWRTWAALGALGAGLVALVWYAVRQPREWGRWGVQGARFPAAKELRTGTVLVHRASGVHARYSGTGTIAGRRVSYVYFPGEERPRAYRPSELRAQFSVEES